MKKLLLLCLLIVGGVSSASAQITEANIMKVYIQNKLVTSWDKIILRHWGYNSSRDAQDVEASGTEIIDGITWYVFKLDIKYANNAPFLVYNGNWGTTTQSANYDTDGSVYGDTFFDLKQNDESSQPYLERQTRFYLYNTDTKMSIKMNTSDFTTYSYSLDNSDGSATGNYAIASNYAFKDYGTGEIKDWNTNTFRPQESGDLSVGFQNYDNLNAPRTSSGGIWIITAKAVHTFTFTPNNWDNAKWSMNPYFEYNMNSYGISTFCTDYAVNIPTGLTASYVSGIGTNNVLTTTNFTEGIPANTGALLEGSAGTYTFTPPTSTNEVSGNMLIGVTANTDITQTDGENTNYILTVNKDGGDVDTPKFFKVNTEGNRVLANKAYLQIPTQAAREFFWFGDDATSINKVKQEKIDGGTYNLVGQRIANPTRGLYIVNGKKVILK